MLEALILSTVFLTSILSGILGMAGGMILMAVLVSTLSVGAAMMLHGAVQAMANGSRAWFLRQHIQWRIIPAYGIGAALTLAAFTALALVPDADLILMIVGLLPFLARLVPYLRGLDVTQLPTAVACGIVVTAAQLFAGASGPLLDVFYLNSKLDRFQII
ncbi:MAG: sulfite exporter TauE/SafE family protein, partial [Pseudomonadota bacterium]